LKFISWVSASSFALTTIHPNLPLRRLGREGTRTRPLWVLPISSFAAPVVSVVAVPPPSETCLRWVMFDVLVQLERCLEVEAPTDAHG